jgi:hypothetical protein
VCNPGTASRQNASAEIASGRQQNVSTCTNIQCVAAIAKRNAPAARVMSSSGRGHACHRSVRCHVLHVAENGQVLTHATVGYAARGALTMHAVVPMELSRHELDVAALHPSTHTLTQLPPKVQGHRYVRVFTNTICYHNAVANLARVVHQPCNCSLDDGVT